jgi:hypothetical protein
MPKCGFHQMWQFFIFGNIIPSRNYLCLTIAFVLINLFMQGTVLVLKWGVKCRGPDEPRKHIPISSDGGAGMEMDLKNFECRRFFDYNFCRF